MLENDLVQSTYEDLVDIYGEDRVLVEPAVEGRVSFRPDLAVKDEDLENFYLVIECSALSSQHREREDLKQLRRLMEETNASYGALISESLRYIFELADEDGELVERELPSFPTDGDMESRGFDSAEEVSFKFWRLAEYFRGVEPSELVKNFYYASFRKLAAERNNLQLNAADLSKQDLERIDNRIAEEYPPFRPPGGYSDEEVKFQKQVLNIFRGINLDKTSREEARVFVELQQRETKWFEGTPLWVSRALIDLTNVNEGDLVLDPAAGYGTIVLEASLRGAEAHAVDVNVDAVNCGIFLNELFGTDVRYTLSDYFQLTNEVGMNYDYGFIHPPFGLQYKQPDGTVIRRGEDKFVFETLERLKPGGVLTVILPVGKFYKQSASEFRQRIRSEYTIKSLIEIHAPIFEYTSIPTVILQIANQPPSEDLELTYAVIDKDDSPQKMLREAINEIRSGEAPTLPLSRLEGKSNLPSEITQLDKLGEELFDRYSEVKEIQEVANEIRGGTKKPEKVYDSPSENRLPYVNIRDLNDGEFSEFIDFTEDVIVADETDVLLSVTGSKIHVHHPNQELAPSSMWAVIRFATEAEALVYAHFLETGLAKKQLRMMQTGSTIQHIQIRRLRELLVPHFSNQDIQEKADAIHERLNRISDLEREQEALENDLEDLLGGD